MANEIDIKIKVSSTGTGVKDVQKQMVDLGVSTQNTTASSLRLAKEVKTSETSYNTLGRAIARNNDFLKSKAAYEVQAALTTRNLATNHISLGSSLNSTAGVLANCNKAFAGQSGILGNLVGQVGGLVAAYASMVSLQTVLGILKDAERAQVALTVAVAGANAEYSDMGSLEEWQGAIEKLMISLRIYSDDDLANATAKIIEMTGEMGLSKDQMLGLVEISANLAAKTGDLDGTVMKLTGALAGQAKGARSLGVFLKDTTVATKLSQQEDSIKFQTLTEGEKVQARYNILVDQTAQRMSMASEYSKTFNGALMEVGVALDGAVGGNQELIGVLNEFGQVLVANKDKLADMATGALKAVAAIATFTLENKNLVLAFAALKVGSLILADLLKTAGMFVTAAQWIYSFNTAVAFSRTAMLGLVGVWVAAAAAAAYVGYIIGGWINTFGAVRVAAQTSFGAIYVSLLTLQKGYLVTKQAAMSLYGADTSGVQAQIGAINQEIDANMNLIASIQTEGDAVAATEKQTVESEKAKTAAREAGIKVLKDSATALEAQAATTKQAYEQEIRDTEIAGTARKDSETKISTDLLNIKIKYAAQVQIENQKMLKATMAAEAKAGAAGVEATKKANDEIKKSYLALQDLKITALKQYNDAVQKGIDIEKSTAEKLISIERTKFDIQNKGVSEYSRLQKEAARADQLIADVNLTLLKGKALTTAEIEKCNKKIEEANGLYAGQAIAVDLVAGSEETRTKTLKEGISISLAGLSKVEDATKALGKIEKTKNDDFVSDSKKALDTITDLFKVATADMAKMLDESLKERDVKIVINEAAYKEVIEKINAIKDKTITITTVSASRTESSAGSTKTTGDTYGGQGSTGDGGYAKGGLARLAGYLPGDSSVDDVPAMLMRGEFVMRKDAVKKYGTDFLYALNGLALPKFATGGFVDEQLSRKIKEAEAKVFEFQRRIQTTTSYGKDQPENIKQFIPQNWDLNRIMSGGKPEESLKYIQLLQGNVTNITSKINPFYETKKAEAIIAGNPEVADLLDIEQSDIQDLIATMSDSIAEVYDTLKTMVDELNEAEAQIIDEFKAAQAELKAALDEKVKEQQDLQAKIKANLSKIKQKNADELGSSGLEKADVDSYFKSKDVSGSLADLPSQETITKKINYKVARDGRYHDASGNSLDYIIDADTGQTVWYPGMSESQNPFKNGKANTEISGSFYNPRWLDLGKEETLNSRAAITQAKSENKTANNILSGEYKTNIAAVNSQRQTGKQEAFDNISRSSGEYGTGLETLKVIMRAEAATVTAELSTDLKDAQVDLVSAQLDFDAARKAWEEEEKLRLKEEAEKAAAEKNAVKSGTSSGTRVSTGRTTAPSAFQYFANGGLAEGAGMTDSVKAMLTPGEYVVKRSVTDFFGSGFFDMLNNMDVKRFAAGGLVAGATAGPRQAENMGTLSLTLGGNRLDVQAGQEGIRDFYKSLRRAKQTAAYRG